MNHSPGFMRAFANLDAEAMGGWVDVAQGGNRKNRAASLIRARSSRRTAIAHATREVVGVSSCVEEDFGECGRSLETTAVVGPQRGA